MKPEYAPMTVPGGFSLRMRRARGWLTEDRGRYQAAYVVSFATMAVGLTLLWDDHVVAGVPVVCMSVGLLWLTGAWVFPFGVDAWQRRVSRVLRDGTAAQRQAQGLHFNRQRALSARIARLEPPQRVAAEHRRLVALLEEIDALRERPPSSIVERVGRLIALRHDVDDLVSLIEARAGDDEERRLLVRTLSDARAEQRDSHQKMVSESERAAKTELDRLARMRPPAGCREEHEQLLQLKRSYLPVLHTYYQAAFGDRNAAIAAAQAVQDRHAALQALRDRLATEFRASFGGRETPSEL